MSYFKKNIIYNLFSVRCEKLAPTPSPSPTAAEITKRKIIKWLFFNILFALIPLIYRIIRLCLFNSCANPLNLLYQQGELLLLSTAVFAEAIGELTNTEPRNKNGALILMGISFLAIILNTNMFLDLKNFKNVNLVAIWSIVIYATSIFVGLTSKIIGKD
ncbi:hypothetical protein [Scytonema sp. NUACC26]|uniref:hypothetical protein n=1 Tax=Scytonema sp. NUACC26 TaxID=3140176 RepID=UPI0034DC61DB